MDNSINEVNLVVAGGTNALHSVELGNSKLFVQIDGKLVELDVQMFQITDSNGGV